MHKTKGVLFVVLVGMLLSAGSASAGLVGYFKFDSFTGMAFQDDSGQGLKGFLGQPFSVPASVPGPSGDANDKAVSFDGRGGLVVDDSAKEVLNILEPPITLEAWVRSETVQNVGHYGLISYGIPGGRPNPGGYKLGINNGNLLFTTFGVVDVVSQVAFPFDGAWHHVAAVYSDVDGGVTYYLDGVEEQFIAETRAMRNPGNKELDIGAQYTAIGRFNGDMDRVRVSKAALKVDELDSNATSVKAVGANTVAYFSFDEGAVPYTSQGVEPKSTAVSLSTWVLDHPPAESTGRPTIAADSPSGAAGDTSLQFDGTQIAFVNDPKGVLNFSTGDWTFEAWVKTEFNTTGERMVLFYYGNPGHGYSMSIDVELGVLQVTTLGIADMPSSTALVPADMEWHHLAVAHKAGTSITYFVDGQEIETTNYTRRTNAAEQTILYIGAEYNSGLPYTGLIDRIRISNSALTAGELDSKAAPAPVLGWELQ